MSVRAKLLAGFAGVFVPIGVLSLIVLATLSAGQARTHEIYQQRLVAIVTLGQTVENLDQMRQMVQQYVLTTDDSSLQSTSGTGHAAKGSTADAIRKQQRAIVVQLATLDRAISQTMADYRHAVSARRKLALLQKWPASWKAFLQVRSKLLQRSAGTASLPQSTLHVLTVTLNDRLDTVLDVVYALMGAEQRQGHALDQMQQDAYQRTLAMLAGGIALVAVVSLTLATTLTRSVTRLYEEVEARAVHDSLTGLLNHRVFLERLDSATTLPTPWALVLVDVDNFKLFNDTYGHTAGDAVLCAVTALLQASCRESDTVARYGGDEFALLLPGSQEDEARALQQRLDLLAQSQPYRTPDDTLVVLRLSVGFACYPSAGRTRQELLAVADAAMYAAKHRRSSDAYQRAAAAIPYLRHMHMRAGADLLGDSPFGILEGLVNAVDAKDCYTREHSEDVTRWALLLADALNLPPDQRRALALAGPLHDVGKIAVPDRILRKPGKLTEEEYTHIKHHVVYGVAIIKGVLQEAMVVDAVAYHHERWDGRGYPHGLSGPDTPLLGRIMQVADAVSAMALDRPYRQGLPWIDVLERLRGGAGTQFDPVLVDCFLEAVRRQEAEGRAAS